MALKMAYSRRAKGRDFYYEVRNNFAEIPGIWYTLAPGLYWYKHKYVWVSKDECAFYMKDLGTGHLINILKVLKERHPENKRWPLELEYQWRKVKMYAIHGKRIRRY